MSEVLLVRHAMSTANARNPAFGNEEAPLTELGIEQATELVGKFAEHHKIVTADYIEPVAVSEYKRPQETAHHAGFNNTAVLSLINEGSIPPGMLRGREIVNKHATEGWIPDELKRRAAKLIKLIENETLSYQIYFTHGLFIAAVLTELGGQDIPFDEHRGYIPTLATITPVQI